VRHAAANPPPRGEPSSTLGFVSFDVAELMAAAGHEQVVFVSDAAVGLRGIIAVHSTALGPSLGGIRFWHYDTEEAALRDVLALSEAMSYKAAMAGLAQGGGKMVVRWDDPHEARSERFLRAIGRAVDRLRGRYYAAEDVGASERDMDGVALETQFVTGVDPARGGSGDPSPMTAFGVMCGMQAACDVAFGSSDLRDRKVVVQGAGHVGAVLVDLLLDAGASVVAADVDRARAEALGVRTIAPDAVFDEDCDVLAPCALGGVLTVERATWLRAKVVCGAANNQLVDAAADDALAARGIVYAPDFVVNAGGIINIAQERHPDGYSAVRARSQTARIEATTHELLTDAHRTGVAPGRLAVATAKARIQAAADATANASAQPRTADQSVAK
jgi:valine dehydrogenase (NAD+)